MTLEEAKQKAMEQAMAEGEPITEPAPTQNEEGTGEPVTETEPTTAEPTTEEAAPVEPTPENQQNVITEQAIQAAEAATAQMQQMQAQMQQMQAQMMQAQEQNQHLQETIRQMSEQHEEAVVNQAMQNQVPQLDFSSLAFEDPEKVAQMQADYAQQMSQFVRGEIMQELQPYIDRTKSGLEAREIDDALGSIEQTPELSHIREMQPQLEQIIKANKVLAGSDASMEDKLIMAYAIAKGVDAIQNPIKAPTAEEMFAQYNENEDFRRLVEQDRIKKAKSQPTVPPFSAGGGAGNAALNVPEKPKTLEEAKALAMKKWNSGN